MTDSDTTNEDRDRRRYDPLGSAAEEALKLFDAIQRRVGREVSRNLVKSGMSGLGFAFGTSGASRGDDVWSAAVAEAHDEEYICRACPVCRVIAAGKADGDVADHLIAAGGELFTALREAVRVVRSTWPEAGRPGTDGSPGEPSRQRVDTV